MDQTDGWLVAMADAIAARALDGNAAIHLLYVGNVLRAGPLKVQDFQTRRSPPSRAATTAEMVLVVDWSEVNGAINQIGVNSTEVAEVIGRVLMDTQSHLAARWREALPLETIREA